MAGKDSSQKLGKLVETGLSVAKLAQAKAEEALRDVAHISEAQRNQMREIFEEASKKSRESTESLIKNLRKEIEKQLTAANTISKEEFGKFSERLSSLSQDLGKMTSLREELSKLTDALNSLIRSLQKQEPQKEGQGEEPPASTEVHEVPSAEAESSSTEAKPRAAKPKSASPRTRSRASKSSGEAKPDEGEKA